MNADVLIIGGGMAGLCCAKTLIDQGFSTIVLEASDDVGGRVRTDEVDGFSLDRGFQVFLTAYPEAQRFLNYSALSLHSFYSGALVRLAGQFHQLSDPFRHPIQGVRSLLSPIGCVADKLRVTRMRQKVMSSSLQEIFQKPEVTTMEFLRGLGFSNAMIDRFYRTFLGGVFLDPDLQTSSRATEFVLKIFATGDATLPAGGMSSIPQQLVADLPQECVRTRSRVSSMRERTVVLGSGETLTARAIVVATQASESTKLIPDLDCISSRRVACLYYAADVSPIDGPYLVLNGERRGPINNLCVPSEIAASYAPPNQALISTVVLDSAIQNDQDLEIAVRGQLREWFGQILDTWRHARTYRISEALPRYVPRTPYSPSGQARFNSWLYVCEIIMRALRCKEPCSQGGRPQKL